MIRFNETKDGVRMKVKVVPGASRDRIVGALGDALKVAVSQPPAGGAANAAVTRLLADALGVAPAQVQILRGHTNPRKEIIIAKLTAAEAARRLGLRQDG